MHRAEGGERVRMLESLPLSKALNSPTDQPSIKSSPITTSLTITTTTTTTIIRNLLFSSLDPKQPWRPSQGRPQRVKDIRTTFLL